MCYNTNIADIFHPVYKFTLLPKYIIVQKYEIIHKSTIPYPYLLDNNSYFKAEKASNACVGRPLAKAPNVYPPLKPAGASGSQ